MGKKIELKILKWTKLNKFKMDFFNKSGVENRLD